MIRSWLRRSSGIFAAEQRAGAAPSPRSYMSATPCMAVSSAGERPRVAVRSCPYATVVRYREDWGVKTSGLGVTPGLPRDTENAVTECQRIPFPAAGPAPGEGVRRDRAGGVPRRGGGQDGGLRMGRGELSGVALGHGSLHVGGVREIAAGCMSRPRAWAWVRTNRTCKGRRRAWLVHEGAASLTGAVPMVGRSFGRLGARVVRERETAGRFPVLAPVVAHAAACECFRTAIQCGCTGAAVRTVHPAASSGVPGRSAVDAEGGMYCVRDLCDSVLTGATLGGVRFA